MTARSRFCLTALVLTALATSCVVPVDDAALPIESVPVDLFPTTSAPTNTTATPDDSPNFALQLYWQFDDGSGAKRLVLVERFSDERPTPQEALAALVGGPLSEEIAEFEGLGIFSRQTTEVLSPVATQPNENGVLRVAISSDFGLRGNDPAKIPLAEELVCTLTSLPGINGIVIEDAEGEIPLPDLASVTIVGAAARSNYNCDPEPIAPSVAEEEG